MCMTKGFPFVSHRGAQTRPPAMIRTSGPLQRIFTRGRRSPGRLLARLAWSMRSASTSSAEPKPLMRCTSRQPNGSLMRRARQVWSLLSTSQVSGPIHNRPHLTSAPVARESAIFGGATVIRPAVLFGRDDKFLNTLIKLLHRLPVFPMFGRGETRLQPADVEDVAEAVATVMQRTETAGLTFECGGPRAYSYEELLRTI